MITCLVLQADNIVLLLYEEVWEKISQADIKAVYIFWSTDAGSLQHVQGQQGQMHNAAGV